MVVDKQSKLIKSYKVNLSTKLPTCGLYTEPISKLCPPLACTLHGLLRNAFVYLYITTLFLCNVCIIIYKRFNLMLLKAELSKVLLQKMIICWNMINVKMLIYGYDLKFLICGLYRS